jgi:4a-hydroxytetrahydrobiopterin dehydratase
MLTKSTEREIAEALERLPGWTCKDGSLVGRYSFKTYMDGIRFVEMVAVDAEAKDHHPDLLVRYSDVTVFLKTHSADGVTGKDLDSATGISAIAAMLGGA